jgi:hypothetical protein
MTAHPGAGAAIVRRLILMPALGALLVAATLVALNGGRQATADQPGHPAHATHTTHAPGDTAAAATFHDAMRRLWEDHIVWTRQYLVSAIAGLPDTDTAAARLLRNQQDIGDAVKPFYGDAAGDQLAALLREHIVIAVDLVAAAKANDGGALTDAQARWQANADEIAAILATANPDAWPRAEMAAMMRGHLALTTDEAVARLTGDWAADVAAYDAIHAQILEMADMLSDGIIRQFPDRFR